MVCVHRILSSLRAQPGVTDLRESIPTHQIMMSRPPYSFLKGQVMMSIDI